MGFEITIVHIGIAVALGISAFGSGLIFSARKKTKTAESLVAVWTALARELGATEKQVSAGVREGAVLRGELGKYTARIELSGGNKFRIEIRGKDVPWISLRSADDGPGDYTTGDVAFDRRVSLASRRKMPALAVLHAKARKEIITLVSAGGRVKDGRVIVRGFVEEVEAVVSKIAPSLRLLDVLRASGEPDVERLSRIAREDPVMAVRRTLFNLLVEMLPDHQDVQMLARGMARDTSFEGRIQAALVSGEPELLAQLAQSDVAWDGARAEAIEKMATLHEWPERRQGVCTHAYQKGGEKDRLAAVTAMRLAEEPHLVNDISKRASSLSAKEAVATYEYLKLFQEHIPELVALVGLRTDDEWTQWGSVSELERLGSAAAVPPLMSVADDPNASDRVRSRARDAVVAVSQRLGLEGGRVSTAPTLGQVSRPTDGRLSEN